MYSDKLIKNLRKDLFDCYDDPIIKLMKATGLTRPTINKFLVNNELAKPSSADLIVEKGTELVRKKVMHRRSLERKLKKFSRSDEKESTN